MPLDILNLHNRVIYQNPNCKGQSQEGHPVEGIAKPLHHRKGWNDGEGERHPRNQRRSPIFKEKADRNNREDGPDNQGFDGGSIGIPHVIGLSHNQFQRNIFWQNGFA